MKILPPNTMIGLVSALLLGAAAARAETGWSLSADTWAQPRDGRAVAQMPPLPEVVAAWSRAPEQRLVLRHPGGEEGLLWAHELGSWLTALGIPTQHQELVPGSARADRIGIELISR